jgi:hypothetical protein
MQWSFLGGLSYGQCRESSVGASSKDGDNGANWRAVTGDVGYEGPEPAAEIHSVLHFIPEKCIFVVVGYIGIIGH